MTSKRVWTIINISLALMAFLLLLNFFGVILPSLGQAQLILDPEDPLCVVNWKDEYNQWDDLDRCCFEIQKLAGCNREIFFVEDKGFSLDWRCGRDNVANILLNNKAYNYCRQQRIWVS